MQIKINAPKLWLASEAVDFRKAINGLSELVMARYEKGIGHDVYIFYNRARNKLKLLGYHRNGFILITKHLDKKRFTLPHSEEDFYCVTQEQLSWLLAGLDWLAMSEFNEMSYSDFY